MGNSAPCAALLSSRGKKKRTEDNEAKTNARAEVGSQIAKGHDRSERGTSRVLHTARVGVFDKTGKPQAPSWASGAIGLGEGRSGGSGHCWDATGRSLACAEGQLRQQLSELEDLQRRIRR